MSGKNTSSGSARKETVRQRPVKKRIAVHKNNFSKVKAKGSLLGLLVFAFGLGAVLAVLYLGYDRFYKHSGPIAPIDQVIDLKSAKPQSFEYKGTQDVSTLRKSSLSEIRGNWKAAVGEKQAYIMFDRNNRYRMLYVSDENNDRRYYSNGVYSYEEEHALLTLTPTPDRSPSISGMQYKPITTRAYRLFMVKDPQNNALIWKPYIDENGLQDQIHPLLLYMNRGDSFLGWYPL